MSKTQPVAAWFAEYGDCHQHPVNEAVHWICVPTTFAALLGLVWSVPVPEAWQESVPWFNWVLLFIAISGVFYARLSPAVGAGVLMFMAVTYAGLTVLEFSSDWPVWKCSSVALAAAGLGRWLGDRLETRPPTPRQHVGFFLLAPAWLLGRLFQRIGQTF